MRNVNYAAYVNEKAPQVKALSWFRRAKYRNVSEDYIRPSCSTSSRSCGIMVYTYCGESMPVRSKSKSQKLEALRQEGTLNPTPNDVHDPKFLENEFFDPHDIV